MTVVIGRGLYGMYGVVTDPGEREFTLKVAELGVDVGQSPYPDYAVNQIVADFTGAPADATLLLWGSSLGANNCPVVARWLPRQIPGNYIRRVIHGMWGFQASDDGAKVPIPSNVLFAHEVYNPLWIQTMGLGHYEWVLENGNTTTNLYTSKRYDFHPGETEQAQAMFLREIQRVIEKPNG